MKSTFRIVSSDRAREALCAFFIVAVTGSAAPQLLAGTFTLTDANSSAHFDTGSPINNDSWIVDGANQLRSQAFWFRIGDNPEQSVHSLPIFGEIPTNTNFDPGLDTLFVQYNGSGFQIQTRYGLQGGTPGSGASDLSEQISIISTSASPLNFHFFQYADFDLRGTPGQDTAVFENANAVRQSQGPIEVSETVFSPPANHREIAFFPTTLNELNDGAPTTLSDITGPIGPGNVTWANQWDFLLQPSATFVISKDKRLSSPPVPEPAVSSLLCVAAGLLLAGCRKRTLA